MTFLSPGRASLSGDLAIAQNLQFNTGDSKNLQFFSVFFRKKLLLDSLTNIEK